MIFGAFILFVALAISGIAAFYSIIGLIAIFAAAAVPVIVMGGALEVGKIATTVWLHTNWHRAPRAFKIYLVPAVAILMFVTSMGIFGFLSKAHIEQTAMSDEQRAEITTLTDKITRSEAKIARWNAELGRLNKGEDQRVDNLVDKDSDALKDIYAQVDREKANARADAERAIALQQERLQQAADRKDKDIAAAQKRKEQDVAQVQDRFKNSFSKGKMDEAIAEINKIELEAVQTAKNNELSVASAAQREIKSINATLNKRLSEIDAKYKTSIDAINQRVQKLRDQANTKTDDIDARVAELEAFIDKEQLSIDQIREETAVYEKEYRKLEAEVGPIKYVAALIYGDNPDVNMLERAVRWVIILLVVVFDPLALTLILAATKQFQWVKEERENPTYAHKEYTKEDDDLMNEMYPPQPTMKSEEEYDPRIQELELEIENLKKKNLETKPEVEIREVYVEANVDTSMPEDVAELEDTVEKKIKGV